MSNGHEFLCLNMYEVFSVATESHWLKAVGIVQMLSQTRDAGFSKQNYYEKIVKTQRKNIKITKHYRQGG